VGFRDKTDVIVVKEYPPKPKDSPIAHLVEEPQNREYEPVCMISATGGSTIFNSKRGSDLLKKMDKDARKCGADALIIRTTESQTWKWGGGFDGARAQAVAIRYLE